MNNSDFDNALRTGMPALDGRESLDRKINLAIATVEHKRSVTRRWLVASSATAALVAALVILPASSAQAGMARIAGALDDVKTVRMERLAITDLGTRILHGSMDYDQGKWRMTDSPDQYQIYRDGKTYYYEPLAGKFLVESRPQGPFGYNSSGLGLSAMLKGGGFGSDSVSDIVDGRFQGRDVKVATISRPLSHEKTVIYADAKTELPIEAHSLSDRGGTWTLREILTFDYTAHFAPSHFIPDPAIKLTTREAFRKSMMDEMTKDRLVVRPQPRGEFILRKVDVARDGTVFVSYQIGDRSRSYSGARLTIHDDLGTEYAAPQESFVTSDNDPNMDGTTEKDGRLNQEIFVPLEPSTQWTPRTITLSGQFSEKGEMTKFTYGFSKQADGTWLFKKFSNTRGVDLLPPAEKIWKKQFNSPTCDLNPEYMRHFDFMSFSTELKSQIYRTSLLSRRALNFGEKDAAIHWLEKGIALKRRAVESGEQPMSFDDDLSQLKSLRTGIPNADANGQPPIASRRG